MGRNHALSEPFEPEISVQFHGGGSLLSRMDGKGVEPWQWARIHRAVTLFRVINASDPLLDGAAF